VVFGFNGVHYKESCLVVDPFVLQVGGVMIAIRKTLQKDVFGSGEDRLVSLINVTKPGRKKKPSFLCASGNRN